MDLCSLSLVNRLLKLTTWTWPILHLNHHHIVANFSHASDDKNATLDDWMKWRGENDLSDGMRSEVIPILYFTLKHSHRETEVKQGLNSATSRGTRNKAGSRVRKDNYGDICLLEMCWERGRQQAWLFLPSPAVKVCQKEPCGPRRAWSQVLLTGGGPGARSRRPTWGLLRALTHEFRST